MRHGNRRHVTKILLHGIIIIIFATCIPACRQKEYGRNARTKEQLSHFIQLNDSILCLKYDVPSLCDSLMAEAGDSLEYYDYCILKGHYFLLTAQPDTALTFARKTMAFANRMPETPRTMGLKAMANSTEASLYHLLRRNQEEAIRLNTAAYHQILKSDLIYYSPEIAANLADTYIAVDDMPNGAKWYRRALLLVDSLGLPETKNITLYMGLGQIYTSMQDYASAKHYYEMTERQFDKMKSDMQSYFLNNYGNYYYFIHDYKNALKTFERLKSLLLEANAGDTPDMFLCMINMSDIFLNLGMTDSAEVYVDKAARYFEENEVEDGVFYANTIKMGIAMARGDMDAVARIIGNERPVKSTVQSLRNIRSEYLRKYYVATGNYEEAYKDLLNNRAENDSLEHNRTYMRAAEIMMKFTEDTLRLHHQLEIKDKDAKVSRSETAVAVAVSVTMALAFIVASGTIIARKRRIQTRMEILTLRLKNTRQRISPHFIFNVLNAKIGAATEKEADTLLKLAGLTRASLDMSGKAWITLKEELDFVTDYINLQKILMGDDFEFTMQAPATTELDEIKIPPMFVQILVENAIKHGLKNTSGHKQLNIEISGSESATNISVTDNGPGFDIRQCSNTSAKNGLYIIRQTIAVINQENIGSEKISFAINNVEDADGHIRGCKSLLRIPRNIKLL